MFSPESFIEGQTEKLAKEIDGRTIIGVSGGVDSTVAAVLVSRAIGDQLFAVYVNNGFMRKNEDTEVAKTFDATGVRYRILDASDEFLDSLKGVVDPEEKRKIIGSKFIEIFEREAKAWGAGYLVQGTIAPDWIESGGQLRDTIKSHHNVGGLPLSMKLKLVEPLRDLYKDEVRKVARSLGISVSERQPFPGPALAIRILGEVTPERVEVVREACAIVETEIENAAAAGKMEIPWQYFAVLLPLKSVGVQGDVRAYGNTVAVRAVESVDGMTAKYMHIPRDVLERISLRITNEIKTVNRVVYDVTHKPPATIEWE
ncbi:MAG: glutamine-hydrolyzing GMP synthase [Thermoplasmata archaeon]